MGHLSNDSTLPEDICGSTSTQPTVTTPWQQLEESCKLFWTSCDQRFHATNATRLRGNQQFVHIPKCGGSSIESYLHLGFQGHREMYLGGPWGQARSTDGAYRTDFFTLLRHPIERLFSQYHFELRAGPKDMSAYRNVQQRLCEEGTGTAHNITCQPKVTFFQYGLNERLRAAPERGYDNIQFFYLAPKLDASIDDVKRFLTTNFLLVGVTERMLELQRVLARIFGIAVKSDMVATHVKRKAHGIADVRRVLTEEEFDILAARNALDMALWRWAGKRFALFLRCYEQGAPYKRHMHSL